jgi:hypothetical protein
VLLGATALGVAGLLGIVGGILVLVAVVGRDLIPRRYRVFLLFAAVAPSAVLTWSSVVTPLIALLAIMIGCLAIDGSERRHRTVGLREGIAMAQTHRLTRPRRLINVVIRRLARLGLGGRHTYLLTVRGRKTGHRHSTPVTLVENNGRWLVAPYGEVG